MNVKVINIKDDRIIFDNGVMMYSEHYQECCESHFLDFSNISLEDFDGLEFDLDGEFFNRIEDYGIELVPLNGHTVKIPGYASNNGYYSDQLTLVLSNGKTFDITECQKNNFY